MLVDCNSSGTVSRIPMQCLMVEAARYLITDCMGRCGEQWKDRGVWPDIQDGTSRGRDRKKETTSSLDNFQHGHACLKGLARSQDQEIYETRYPMSHHVLWRTSRLGTYN